MEQGIDSSPKESRNSLRVLFPNRRSFQKSQSREEPLGAAPTVHLETGHGVLEVDLENPEALLRQFFSPRLGVD